MPTSPVLFASDGGSGGSGGHLTVEGATNKRLQQFYRPRDVAGEGLGMEKESTGH